MLIALSAIRLGRTECNDSEALVANKSDVSGLDKLVDTLLYAVVRQAGLIGYSFQAGHRRTRLDIDAVPAVASVGSRVG